MQTLEWIFFDVGSTLVEESAAYARWNREVLAGTDITPETMELRRRTLARAGFPGDSAILAALGLRSAPWHPEEERLYPETLPALAALHRHGYRLGIIANQEPGLAQRLEQRGMGGLFSVILSSAEFGLAKPDPRIFTAALKAAHCRPEDALMVGDRLDNDIAPARKLGMRAIRVLQGYGALSQPRDPWEIPDGTVGSLAELLRAIQEGEAK